MCWLTKVLPMRRAPPTWVSQWPPQRMTGDRSRRPMVKKEKRLRSPAPLLYRKVALFLGPLTSRRTPVKRVMLRVRGENRVFTGSAWKTSLPMSTSSE